MESRHDSENAERILYNMRPKELVSCDWPFDSGADEPQSKTRDRMKVLLLWSSETIPQIKSIKVDLIQAWVQK